MSSGSAINSSNFSIKQLFREYFFYLSIDGTLQTGGFDMHRTPPFLLTVHWAADKERNQSTNAASKVILEYFY